MRTLAFLAVLIWLSACKNEPDKLPILGEKEIRGQDTIYPKVRDFSFINQDSQLVTNKTFENKAYIVDFFFVSCPTICPKVARNMLKVHDHFLKDDRVLLLAHSIDTKHDTVPVLRKYADKLGVKSTKWHFVTGEKDQIFDIAYDYFSTALEDKDSPGGFDHSGKLILVDKNRHVRAFCDGTDPKSTDEFILKVEQLLKQEY